MATQGTTMTLVEFLTARLDEDEALARGAKPGPWTADGYEVVASHPTDRVVDVADILYNSGGHIARHDPAKVLREVEAKRRVVELRAEMDALARSSWRDEDLARSARDTRAGLDAVLRILAAVYADHPDYRAEWA